MSGDTVRRAAVQGQTEWLKKLFASGANPCECDEVGLTPLHFAALNGHVDATVCCAANDRGTDPAGERAWALQQQSANGWSALHVAAFQGKKPVDVVRALLELGCDPAMVDDQGRTAADLAEQRLRDTNGSAVAEMVLRTLRQPPPSAAKVAKRRREAKAQHWVQAVRRGNLACIGDYPTPKAARAPVVPGELQVAEEWHVPFAAENAQAVRGAYGVQALRNLAEAVAETEVNALRRFELAHARQLEADHQGKMEFRTPWQFRHENSAIDWLGAGRQGSGGPLGAGNQHRGVALDRHLRGDHANHGRDGLHPGYRPFKHAAFVKPATDAQAEWQATRGAHLCNGNGSAYPTATAAARAAAATDDPEDETTKPPYAQRQQLQYRAYALRKWNTIEYGPELFGERS